MVYKGFTWALCLYIAVVFVQSLFFKFTDAYETLHIFGVLGAWSGFQWFADYGAYGVGAVELVASILLLTPLRALFKLIVDLLNKPILTTNTLSFSILGECRGAEAVSIPT